MALETDETLAAVLGKLWCLSGSAALTFGIVLLEGGRDQVTQGCSFHLNLMQKGEGK